MIRKQRERKAFNKEVERDWNRNYCAAVLAGVAQTKKSLYERVEGWNGMIKLKW